MCVDNLLLSAPPTSMPVAFSPPLLMKEWLSMENADGTKVVLRSKMKESWLFRMGQADAEMCGPAEIRAKHRVTGDGHLERWVVTPFSSRVGASPLKIILGGGGFLILLGCKKWRRWLC